MQNWCAVCAKEIFKHSSLTRDCHSYSLHLVLSVKSCQHIIGIRGLVTTTLQLGPSEHTGGSCSKCGSKQTCQTTYEVFEPWQAKLPGGKHPFPHILCWFLRATHWYIGHPWWPRGNKMFPVYVRGESIKLHAIMLTNAVRTMLSFTWRWPNMDFHEAQVPVYINECKSSLIRPWLERAACWKRQEVGGMLITHWHIASRALPVLALKNYLDYWPKDWSKWWQESFLPAYFDLSGWLWLIR